MSSSTDSTQLQAAIYDVTNIADYRIFPLLLETTLMAFFTVLVAYFVYHRISKGPSGGKTWMLAFTLLSFALAVTSWALDIRILGLELYGLLPRQLSTSPDPDIDAALDQNHGLLSYAQTAIQDVIFVVSDSITFWRAYIICGRPCWIRVTAYIYFSVSVGFWIFSCFAAIVVLPDAPQVIVDLINKHSTLVGGIDTAAFTLVAAGQVFTALLIAHKAWFHWRDVKESLGNSRSMRSIAMLSIVTETGIAYAVLMILSAVFETNTKAPFYWGVFYTPTLSAMYSTLVVVLVAVHGSHIERSIVQAPDLPTIQFSVPPAADHSISCAQCLQRVNFNDTGETKLAGSSDVEKALGVAAGFAVLEAGAPSVDADSFARSSRVFVAM